MILAALAAAAGIGRGVSGIIGAGNQARRDRDLIKRAYQVSKRRMNEAQGYTRQDMNESLNARGVLNGGTNVQRSKTVSDAYGEGAASAKTATDMAGKDILGKVEVLNKNPNYVQGSEDARMAGDAESGQSGDGGTISGQANSDLSREFYGEHQDLFNERLQGIEATKRGQSAGVVNAIGSGIDVGTQVYQAGKMIQGALGAGVSPATGDMGPTSPGVDIRFPKAPSESGAGQSLGGSWFGGYDPVDPLGLSKRKLTNDQFNVSNK